MNHEKRIKDVTVRSVLSSNVYKMIGFKMSSLLQSIILSKLTDDKDVRRFLIMLAVSVEPLSAKSHISSYPKEYADMMKKFETESSLIATW